MSLNNQRFSSEKTKSLRDLFGGNLTEEDTHQHGLLSAQLYRIYYQQTKKKIQG
ncbi:Uncharacterised protein [Escherichia coli]|nr:hypothetical protein [Escherichia coli]CAD5740016.1 Uncharacterised protein [Escherichia coli]